MLVTANPENITVAVYKATAGLVLRFAKQKKRQCTQPFLLLHRLLASKNMPGNE